MACDETAMRRRYDEYGMIRRPRLKCDGTRAETNFFFGRNGRVHLNRRRRQFSELLAAEMCASEVAIVVMLDTPCSEEV
jgi:hypothetical protein